MTSRLGKRLAGASARHPGSSCGRSAEIIGDGKGAVSYWEVWLFVSSSSFLMYRMLWLLCWREALRVWERSCKDERRRNRRFVVSGSRVVMKLIKS